MDNKITKRRLHDFLSYEWIVMIVVAVVGILVWSLIFTMTSVRLTIGQDFLFFYDESVEVSSISDFYLLFDKEDDNTRTVFSYDLMKMRHEELLESNNVLKDRLSVQEGDVIITDCAESESQEETTKSVRAKSLVDSFAVYDFDKLKSDAEEYLAGLLKDQFLDADGKAISGVDVADYNNLDQTKIETLFRQRMRKDNRYRSESQKQEGIKLEQQRIKDLCGEIIKFRYLLSQGDEYFFMYKRYEQMLENGVSDDVKDYIEQAKDTVDKRYGLRVEALSGGKESPTKYFKMKEAEDSKDVVVMVFNFKSYQPHLQFETIAFINAIVDGCSNLYNNL